MFNYASLIALPIFVLILITLWRSPMEWRSKTADVLIAGVVGALIVGRGVHVLVHWRYFADRTEEAMRLQAGGLDWHGVIVGTLLAVSFMGRVRGVRLRDLLPYLAWGIPLIALGAWAGCATAGCAYGREVPTLANYPTWLVWDNADIYGLYAPRFAVQALGIGLMSVLVMVFGLMDLRGIWKRTRFWLALLLVGVTTFALGFFRGDDMPMLLGLRADQGLDGVIIVGSIIGFFFFRTLRF